MYDTKLFRNIQNVIGGLDDVDFVTIWNAYCDEARTGDDCIYAMDELDVLCDYTATEALERFWFGEDAETNCDHANPMRDWFSFNGYANIVTADNPHYLASLDDLTYWIIDNNNSLDNGEFEELLDKYNNANPA